jgi:signal transduction histidine kinase
MALLAPVNLVRNWRSWRRHSRILGATERLPLRLTAFILIPIVSTTIAAGVWALSSLERHLEHRLQREVEMVARALQLPLGSALDGRGPDAVRPALDSAFAIGRVYGAFVYDRTGELVASSAAHRTTSSSDEVSDVIAAGQRTGRYDEVDGREVYSYFVPLNGVGSELVGVLRVTSKKSDLEQYVADLRADGMLLVGLTASVLTALVLLGYYAAVGRSLRSLALSFKRVASGERNHRTTVRGPQELASLSLLFNSMLDSLNEAQAQTERERQARYTMERQLRHAERLAIIGGVTAGVAHEFGTPLSTVGGHAQRLLRQADLDQSVRESLNAVRSQVVRMEGLVRQLLEYGAKQTARRVVGDSRSLVMAAVDTVSALLQRSNVTIGLGGVHAVAVQVDRARIEQALINLLRNAVQAATQRVEVSCQVHGQTILFVFDDDGAGVNPELRQRLYEPFVTDRQACGGSGLGLAICSTVAQEHGGTLSDGLSLLGGARFVLAIPSVVQEDAALGIAR